ncbi:MAG: succinylglutamate desuccinylase/aspartoacylase family protein [Planctomycetota bacterium]|nr:succinylglutamate desuccinylase/aspartoacylase family protein [Planctomycetota bacterium]MDG2143733.1 succinylglutamate desuccinylase/aspartoacylase family protein [Planctomycetota bacterium]
MPEADSLREVGRFDSNCPGALFLAIGGLHGNEPAGIEAAGRVLTRLEKGNVKLRGRFVALRGNRPALAQNQRFIERDLNRVWKASDLLGLEQRKHHQDGPDEGELRDLLQTFSRLFVESCGGAPLEDIVLLDLHSTSGPSTPFLCMADTLQNRPVSFALEVPVILGLEEALEGTLLDYMSEAGHISMAFEGGAHTDPSTIDCHEAAIWCGLVAAGCLDERALDEDPDDMAAMRKRLRRAAAGAPAIVEVLHRHGTHPDDGFVMAPGWANFQPVQRNGILAKDDCGDILSPLTGRLLLPRYQAQGDDGFFVARDVRPIWLRLSAWLRRRQLDRFLHWLPGVTRQDGDPRRLRINRQRALFGVKQVFHLLGYRRYQEDETGFLFLRRPDRLSPKAKTQ